MVESIEELKRICKGREGDWYSEHFDRRVSIYFTKLLLYTPITGNQTTLLFTLMGIAAAILFSLGSVWYVFGGAALLQLFYIIDHVDGEIARYRKQTSLTGAYLEHMGHIIMQPVVFIGIAFGVYQNFPSLAVFAFGFSAALFLMLLDLMTNRLSKAVALYPAIVDFLDKSGCSLTKGKGDAAEQSSSPTPYIVHQVGLTVFLFRYPSVMNVITLAAIANIFFPALKIGSFEFNPMYLTLIIYGITLPILASLYLYWQIITKAVDKEYSELTEAKGESHNVQSQG